MSMIVQSIKKSMQMRLLLVILACVVAAGAVIGTIGMLNISAVAKKDAIQIMGLSCEEKATELEALLLGMEQSANTAYLYADALLTDMEQLCTSENYAKSYTENVRIVLEQAASSADGIVSAYLCFNPDLSIPVAGIFLLRSNGAERFAAYPVTDLSAYEEDDTGHVGWYYIPMKKGEPVWLNPYNNHNIGGVELISYVIPMYKDGRELGVLGMDIDTNLLRKRVSEVTIYETGYAFLCDENSNLIYHKDYPEGIAREKYDEELQQLYVKMRYSHDNELLTYKNGFAKQGIIFQRLRNGMRLAITAPMKEINQEASRLLRNILLLFVLMLPGITLVAFGTAKAFLRPVKELTEVAQKISEGNMNVEIECESEDEVGILAQSFRETVAKLRKHMEYINELAYTDAITGVKNKTAYGEAVTALTEKIALKAAEFAVAVFDVNDLKKVNDNYGHEAGDHMIADAAELLRRSFRYCGVYRIGGDEFAVLMEGDALQQKDVLMETFQQEMAEFNRRSSQRYPTGLKIAAGMAAFEPGLDTSYGVVFRRADDLMYQNKAELKGKRADV